MDAVTTPHARRSPWGFPPPGLSDGTAVVNRRSSGFSRFVGGAWTSFRTRSFSAGGPDFLVLWTQGPNEGAFDPGTGTVHLNGPSGRPKSSDVSCAPYGDYIIQLIGTHESTLGRSGPRAVAGSITSTVLFPAPGAGWFRATRRVRTPGVPDDAAAACVSERYGRNFSGFFGTPFSRTSKCRLTPVVSPELPV